MSSASATVIFSNLADGNGGTVAVENVTFSTWADEFLTPTGSPVTLSDVIAVLSASTGTGTVSALLYSNSTTGNTPNALLNTIATLNHSSIPVTAGQVTFTPGSTITLQPNTEYWIVLSGSDVGVPDALWQVGINDNGPGVATQNHAQDSGGSWASFANNLFTNTIPEMQVDVASGVPEPATFGLLAAGLVGLASLARRRAK